MSIHKVFSKIVKYVTTKKLQYRILGIHVCNADISSNVWDRESFRVSTEVPANYKPVII